MAYFTKWDKRQPSHLRRAFQRIVQISKEISAFSTPVKSQHHPQTRTEAIFHCHGASSGLGKPPRSQSVLVTAAVTTFRDYAINTMPAHAHALDFGQRLLGRRRSDSNPPQGRCPPEWGGYLFPRKLPAFIFMRRFAAYLFRTKAIACGNNTLVAVLNVVEVVDGFEDWITWILSLKCLESLAIK